MTLGQKLVTTFLGCGLVPLAVVGVTSYMTATGGMSHVEEQGSADLEQKAYNQLVALRDVKKGQIEKYFDERQGDMGVLVETVKTLRSEAFNKLTAVREVKRSAVERYFESIHDQMLTFSEDRMIVQAMQEFADAFRRFREESQVDAETLAQQRAALRTYYAQDFAGEYASQNEGTQPAVDAIFGPLDEDSIALQYAFIKGNPHPLGAKHLLDRPADESTYSAIHERVHPIIRRYLEEFGYYDIFLADPETGDIVYSVFKELDYSTSLIDGPYADTNFGRVFRMANAEDNKDAVILVDYEQYPPSYEAPASFIASPIFDGNKKVGVALFQMPIDRLNAIMTERAGLGETGETYLVGPDHLMRSDSYLSPETHSVARSFRNPTTGQVKTDAVQRALSGERGAEVIVDYNGNPVLSAYCPVELLGIRWALLAEVDVAEAFCPHATGSEKDFFTQYTELYGYYDLFLLNPDGYCFYTVCHEADYQTNLANGKYKDSNLGALVREVVKSKDFGFADFAPYAPSNGAPAAFIAEPVLHQGEPEVIVALQLPLDAVNAIMGVRAGMGETGETYLVGPDHLMRSDSYLDPDNHSVVGSFANPAQGSVETAAVEQALGGATGAEIITDYNGNPVLSAYAPINVFGTRWALLAEIDEAEAMAAVAGMNHTAAGAQNQMVTWMSVIGAIAAIIVAVVGVSFARSISKPINRIIAGLNEGSAQVHDAAAQVSSASQQLAEGSSEQAASLEETSSSLEQMAAMTRTNADNARQANALSEEARDAANTGDQTMHKLNDAMTGINESSDKISKIIKVQEEIAFQTNLLALNAAVEAARAGEHGKGFAVVAGEVRNLAQRAAEAARETTQLIEDSVTRARDGSSVAGDVGNALGSIVGSVEKVSELINGIAGASEQQAQGVEQVNHAMSQMDKVTQQNAASAEECASASEELSAQAQNVRSMVDELVRVVGGRADQATAPSPSAAPHPVQHRAPAPSQPPAPATHAETTAPRHKERPSDTDLDDF